MKYLSISLPFIFLVLGIWFGFKLEEWFYNLGRPK